MHDTRALRNLCGFSAAISLVLGILGVPLGIQMQPAELGATFFVAVVVVLLIATVFFVGCAVLTALIELGSTSER